MGWMLFIVVLVAILVYVLWQMELVGKTNKSLQRQMQQREQEMLRLQHAAYQLAEQQKTLLEHQLKQLPEVSVLSAHELQGVRILCQILPYVVKECCSKQWLPQQAVKVYLKQQQTLGQGQLEQLMKKHGRLTPLWQNNSLTSYLQLCTVAVTLAREPQGAVASA